MALSKSNKREVFDEVRKTWVAATPEELVRQSLLHKLVNQLGYPLSLIAVEKELAQLPHLMHSPLQIPDRRIDIVCFGRDLHPLLLIECKSVPISEKDLQQVFGYNHFVNARALALANEKQLIVRCHGKLLSQIPSYEELLHAIDAT